MAITPVNGQDLELLTVEQILRVLSTKATDLVENKEVFVNFKNHTDNTMGTVTVQLSYDN